MTEQQQRELTNEQSVKISVQVSDKTDIKVFECVVAPIKDLQGEVNKYVAFGSDAASQIGSLIEQTQSHVNGLSQFLSK